jgi:hypothetical protein
MSNLGRRSQKKSIVWGNFGGFCIIKGLELGWAGLPKLYAVNVVYIKNQAPIIS